jgi:hypothetical protein
MATVRFSANLKHTIRSNAMGLFTKQMEDADNSFNKELLDGVYDTVFNAWLSHINALPKEFFKEVSQLDVYIRRGATAIRLKLPTPRPIPANNMELPGLAKFNTHYSIPDIYLDSDNPIWEPMRIEYDGWKQRRLDARAKRDEFVAMVNTIIGSHVTLAPALKVWPALWELLPNETREKHKEIKDRKRRDKEEMEGVDLGKLTAAVTVHKLRGG